ncbi:hypothetical protein CAEBREN_13068 [Caenorhabditis brenneri]|uniref:CUB-like domain-containing protein n=1 Tax=Caenorhabditis brenneri TaxID=135651 RepID=G0MAC6_CAEBE|nr:hypothetical protein CAEBREN_13068 [Caenorhabditis brenneri]
MCKTIIILILTYFVLGVYPDAAICHSRTINLTSPDTFGTLPYDSASIVDIPHGTHCLYEFNVPRGYALQLRTLYNLVDPKSALILTNPLGIDMIYNRFGKTINEDYWCTSGTCSLEVQSVSGISFITNYWFKSCIFHFPIIILDFVIFTYSKTNVLEVALTLAQNTSQADLVNLKNYYIYNGSDIIQSALMGTLDDLRTNSLYLGYNFVSIVNFYSGLDSNAFVIGNDRNSISNSYKFILTSPDQMMSREFSDFSEEGTSVTFACSDCNQFYVTHLTFNGASGYVALQGQTPSQPYLSKVITYNASTFTQNQLPQLIPTNKFTIFYYKCNFTIQLYSGSDYQYWKTPYFGRKGVISSATVWDNLLQNGNFAYEFRDNTQLFNFSINLKNMDFGGSPQDQLTLRIGMGPNYDDSISLTFPGANQTNVSSIGNYMYISSNFSMFTKLVLPFEMTEGPSTSTVATSTVSPTISTTTIMPTTIISTSTTKMLTSISTNSPSTPPPAITSTEITSSTPTTTQSSFTSSTTVVTTTRSANVKDCVRIIAFLFILAAF